MHIPKQITVQPLGQTLRIMYFTDAVDPMAPIYWVDYNRKAWGFAMPALMVPLGPWGFRQDDPAGLAFFSGQFREVHMIGLVNGKPGYLEHPETL